MDKNYYDDMMIKWTRTRKKTEIEKIMINEKSHRDTKRELGHRVQILRVLIRRYYAEKRKKFSEDNFSKNCEAVLDNVLSRYDYQLELLIDKWRGVVPK